MLRLHVLIQVVSGKLQLAEDFRDVVIDAWIHIVNGILDSFRRGTLGELQLAGLDVLWEGIHDVAPGTAYHDVFQQVWQLAFALFHQLEEFCQRWWVNWYA